MTDQPSLFDLRASLQRGMAARDRAASRHADEIAALIPLAQELAAKSPDGVTVSDLRLFAVQRGILSGEERGRALAYLGAVMSKAGLVPTGDYRRSGIVKSNGNLHAVWRVPQSAA